MSGKTIRFSILTLGILALSGTIVAAAAPTDFSQFGPPLRYPGAPKPVYDDQKPAYAMNYADEAAQNLGVSNGHMDVFSSQPVENNPFVPVVSGGLGGDGAMLRLQWHPGL